jgi:SH3-like domain-containing protein
MYEHKKSKLFALSIATFLITSVICTKVTYAQEVVAVDPNVLNQADAFFDNTEISDAPPVEAQLPERKIIEQKVQEQTSVIKDITLGQQQPISNTQTQTSLQATLQTKSPELIKLESELALKEKKLNDTLANLQKTQSRLHLAEAESQRLSKILQNNNQKVLSTYSPNIKPAVAEAVAVKPQLAMQGAAVASQRTVTSAVKPLAPSSTNEMLVATVMVDKANLRTGPGKNNSPVMSVSKGTRLAIETRSGEWYRVITPTGARAWILAEVVAFGNRMQAKPSRVVRVKGYDNEAFSMEDEARALISQMQNK